MPLIIGRGSKNEGSKNGMQLNDIKEIKFLILLAMVRRMVEFGFCGTKFKLYKLIFFLTKECILS